LVFPAAASLPAGRRIVLVLGCLLVLLTSFGFEFRLELLDSSQTRFRVPKVSGNSSPRQPARTPHLLRVGSLGRRK